MRFCMLFLQIACVVWMPACVPSTNPSTSSIEAPLFFECGNGIRYPTTETEFRNTYAGRVFFAPGGIGRHLGHDTEYDEGTAIYPIACGNLVVYRRSDGYGTLAAVIEHRLSRRITIHNALNEEVTLDTFLSIGGHIRPTSGRGGTGTPTGLSAGMSVMPNQILGYIEHADERPGHAAEDLNGDGDEHYHLGIRLQSYAEASRTHPSSPFRGYDVSGDGRRYFADPAIFIRELIEAHPVLWHPPGSFLVNRDDTSEGYLVVSDTDIVRVNPTWRAFERLDRVAIPISSAELGCYRQLDWASPPYDGIGLTRHVRFGSNPTVYALNDVVMRRYAYISLEAFQSWGLEESEIIRFSESEREAVLRPYRDMGLRRMRPGSLVSARDSSEVAFVTSSERLPFFSWETFVAMGFEHQTVYEIDSSVMDAVAHPRGAVITPELARLCRVPSCSGSSCGGVGMSGGGGVEDFDAGPFISPDAGTPFGMSCVADRDCPAYGAGWRCQSGTCREVDLDGDGYLGSDGDCNPDVPRIHRGAVETCDAIDEDCDGRADEGFDLLSDPSNCGSCRNPCTSGMCSGGVCVEPCSAHSEVCGNGLDDNCNGTADEGCAPVCTPVAEVCNNRDEDCDTRIDESLSQSCSTACGSGAETCSAGLWVGCTAPLPSTETCDGRDNNCDGRVDEGCAPSCVPTSPLRDICDGRDNDCDGTIDNGCPAMNPYLVEIWMDPSILDDCPDPGGFRINLWGPGGVALQNVIGQPFRRTITSSWVTATPISLSCSVAPLWYDWTGHVGESSSLNGVLVMRMGGRDMLPTSLVCNDMVDPAWGAKPYMPLESRYEGSCTPRW